MPWLMPILVTRCGEHGEGDRVTIVNAQLKSETIWRIGNIMVEVEHTIRGLHAHNILRSVWWVAQCCQRAVTSWANEGAR
jgi:hypothetical protein